MGEKTLISWADHTHNEWIGCTKVSPACDGCYAEAMMDKRYGRVKWGGPGAGNGTRSLTSEANRRKPYAWNRIAERDGTRPFVFCSSLADIFDNQIPPAWRRALYVTIRETPNLVWLLLSKRPQNMVRMSAEAGGLPSNAALGATCEDQQRYDLNLPHLRYAKGALNPAFTFVSAEPLLGPLALGLSDRLDPDWIITGGETDQGGHKARPTNPQWFRDIRDQCAAAGKAFHHKQNGEWVSVSEVEGRGEHFTFPDGRSVRRVGKHHSGRTIDGAEHNGFPSVAA